jgi:hypothetical protein
LALARERLLADRVELRRDVRVELARRADRGGEHGAAMRGVVVAGEQPLAHQRFPQHDAEREHIGAPITGVAAQLLGGSIAGHHRSRPQRDAAVELNDDRERAHGAERLAGLLRRVHGVGGVADDPRAAELVEPARRFGDCLQRHPVARLAGAAVRHAQHRWTSGLAR